MQIFQVILSKKTIQAAGKVNRKNFEVQTFRLFLTNAEFFKFSDTRGNCQFLVGLSKQFANVLSKFFLCWF